jgi:hypothetical protein
MLSLWVEDAPHQSVALLLLPKLSSLPVRAANALSIQANTSSSHGSRNALLQKIKSKAL